MKKRINGLEDLIIKEKLDGVILTDGYNIHYLSGYKGHTGCMLVLHEKKYILTDSRYTEQVGLEASDFECVDIGLDGYSKCINNIIQNKSKESNDKSSNETSRFKLGFENEHISYKQHKAFADTFGVCVELVPLDNKVDALRMVKDEYEIECIAKAESIGDEAFSHMLEFIQEGLTEKQIALELEYVMKSLGADGLSFDTIAASGPNSSLPHAVPTDRKLQDGDFLTMDFGCIYKGYCSDMTRTVFIGENPTEKQMEVYTVVLKAQREALKLVKPGAKCSDIDACARKIISDAGYGEYFGHGLGHSVGLYIHEEPRCSRKCDTILEAGMTMTIEPGIYLPGEFGVRIEDLVVVTEDGYKNLASSEKNLFLLA